MNCKQRNKKLFKNIALGILILVIVYIFVEVFFSGKKIQEGMSSNDDIIDYKKDVESWTFTPEEIAVYIQAENDVVMEKSRKANIDNNDNNEDNNVTAGHMRDLGEKIKRKIGNANFNLLDNIITKNPDGELGELKAERSDETAETNKALLNDIKKTMNTLIEDMEKRRAKTTTSD